MSIGGKVRPRSWRRSVRPNRLQPRPQPRAAIRVCTSRRRSDGSCSRYSAPIVCCAPVFASPRPTIPSCSARLNRLWRRGLRNSRRRGRQRKISRAALSPWMRQLAMCARSSAAGISKRAASTARPRHTARPAPRSSRSSMPRRWSAAIRPERSCTISMPRLRQGPKRGFPAAATRSRSTHSAPR